MKERVAVITGGAGGIGRSLASTFLSAGYSVCILDSDSDRLQNMKEEAGANPSVLFLSADISSENDILDAKKSILEAYGRTDCIINNAAVSHNKPLLDLERKEWDEVLAVNLTGPFLMAKHFAAELKKVKGSIVNIASTRASMSESGTEAYSASKGGLVSLTHALSASLAPDIRVNAVSPGWIHITDEPLSEEDHRQHPAGRVGMPEDVSELALFLASGKSGFITGQNFTVDGGMTKKMMYL